MQTISSQDRHIIRIHFWRGCVFASRPSYQLPRCDEMRAGVGRRGGPQAAPATVVFCVLSCYKTIMRAQHNSPHPSLPALLLNTSSPPPTLPALLTTDNSTTANISLLVSTSDIGSKYLWWMAVCCRLRPRPRLCWSGPKRSSSWQWCSPSSLSL